VSEIPQYTDGKLAMELRRMAVDAELSGDDCWRILAAAAHRIEVINQHKFEDGIWSYYRNEMWRHGGA